MQNWRRRWEEQVELLRLMRHPGVVGVHEQFEGALMHPRGQAASAGGHALYLVMNWAEGEDLRDWVPRHLGPEQRSESMKLLTQVAAVLDWMHSGRATPSGRPVVHGDVTPANILVDQDGQAVLVDFGLVRIARHVTRTARGTLGYAAPEVIHRGEYSPASDRYGFGGLAHYVLTGQHPTSDPAEQHRIIEAIAAGPQQTVPLDQLGAIFAPEPRRRPPCGEWLRLLRLQSSTGNLRPNPGPGSGTPPVVGVVTGPPGEVPPNPDPPGQPGQPGAPGQPSKPGVTPPGQGPQPHPAPVPVEHQTHTTAIEAERPQPKRGRWKLVLAAAVVLMLVGGVFGGWVVTQITGGGEDPPPVADPEQSTEEAAAEPSEEEIEEPSPTPSPAPSPAPTGADGEESPGAAPEAEVDAESWPEYPLGDDYRTGTVKVGTNPRSLDLANDLDLDNEPTGLDTSSDGAPRDYHFTFVMWRTPDDYST